MGESDCCCISEIVMSEREKEMKHWRREKNRDREGGLERDREGNMIMQWC